MRLRATLLCPAGRLGVVISLPLVPSGGWSASRARSEPALTALAGAMVGLAMAVAAVLAERRPSVGAAGVAAGVSADLVTDVDADVGAGIGANQGRSAEAMSWRPPAWRGGILAGSRVRSSPDCADAARFWLEHGNRQPAPFSAVRAVRAVRLASIPATRLRKAAASSQAWGLAAGMASAWRAAVSCRVLSAGPSRP